MDAKEEFDIEFEGLEDELEEEEDDEEEEV